MQANQLLRTVATEDLRNFAVYVADYQDTPDAFRDPLCKGYTSPLLDLQLQPWLESRGEWAGRGFACVVDAERFPTFPDLAGALLHEFAHWLDGPLPEDDDRLAESLAEPLTTCMAANHRLPLAERSYYQPNLPPWHQHGSQFVRACCHLANRAGALVASIRPRHLVFGKAYGLASEQTFMNALASELSNRGSIREILTTQPPQRFTDLWETITDANA